MTQENIPLQLGEIIRPISGYEGLYSITSFGRVWSHKKIAKLNGRTYRAKFLKLQTYKFGYLYIGLHKNNICVKYLIHRIEAIAFIENPLNLPQVNHRDGDKQNNYVGTAAKNYKDGNLEWCTNQSNQDHAVIYNLKNRKYSKYYGVGYYKHLKKNPWVARITINKKRMYLGVFKTEIEAAQAYNDYVIKHNLNRPLNKIEGGE